MFGRRIRHQCKFLARFSHRFRKSATLFSNMSSYVGFANLSRIQPVAQNAVAGMVWYYNDSKKKLLALLYIAILRINLMGVSESAQSSVKSIGASIVVFLCFAIGVSPVRSTISESRRSLLTILSGLISGSTFGP
jgi:hypothetical protein